MSWTIAPVGRGSNLIYSQAGMPSLDLRFAETKSLNDFISSTNLITFTRASNATFIDSNGLIQTATTDVPRFDHNPATGESLGLLIEEQRVNLLLNSETLATQTVTVTAAARTLSFYGTGSVVLSGAHSATVNGTGAYPTRTTLTFTPTAGSLTLTVTGTVQYANLEAGAFATSWIPTTGTTATRSADVASITGANFSRWYRQDEGTVFASYRQFASGGNIVTISDGTVANFINTFTSSVANQASSANVFVSGVNNGRLDSGGVFVQNAQVNSGYALSSGSRSFVASNGLLASSPTPASMPVVNRLNVGSAATSSTDFVNGTIRRLTYWPARLPNNVLQTITQ
jgi:hypothetical protein